MAQVKTLHFHGNFRLWKKFIQHLTKGEYSKGVVLDLVKSFNTVNFTIW